MTVRKRNLTGSDSDGVKLLFGLQCRFSAGGVCVETKVNRLSRVIFQEIKKLFRDSRRSVTRNGAGIASLDQSQSVQNGFNEDDLIC